MTDWSSISRRRFILVSSSVAAAASAAFAGGCAGRYQPPLALTAAERAIVEAVADQIVPPDQDPGGKAAGLADFIDIQLRGPYARYVPAYRDGLLRLDATSRRLRQKPFVGLSLEDQTAMLTALEDNRVPSGIWKPGESSEFFRLICDHCMQGYYGSPRHGGNRGGASWKMLKLDYPQLAGRVLTVDR
jgi:gluconate 2-dehydrogenase gamma chain